MRRGNCLGGVPLAERGTDAIERGRLLVGMDVLGVLHKLVLDFRRKEL
jgi:hypothetical protein